jgi:sugar phosphate isomerase/epimerase
VYSIDVASGVTPPSIRLSCGDHSFPLVPHDLALDLISRLGFDGVNLVLWGNRSKVNPDDVRSDPSGWADRLGESLRSRALEVADLVCIAWTDYETLALNHPDAAERQRSMAFFTDMVEFAACLGVPGMTILPGIDWPDEEHEESLARVADELAPRVAAAAAAGVALSIEPHVGSVCHTPAEVMAICEQVPDVSVTLDYTHFLSEGFAEVDVDPLLVRTRHLHARGGAAGRIQTPWSENTIDYDRIVGRLVDDGYDGFVAIEYCWVDWEGMNNVDVISESVILRDHLRALPGVTAGSLS